MAEDKKDVDIQTEKIEEDVKTLHPILDILSSNDYRSDLIIAMAMALTFFTYFHRPLGDEIFGQIVRWGMVLVAVEYIGHEVLEKILQIKM